MASNHYNSSRGYTNNHKVKTILTFTIRDESERRHRSGINALQIDQNNNYLYTACRDSIIRCWNVSNDEGTYIRSMEHHSDWVNDLVLCHNGKTIISGSSDTTVKVWDAVRGCCQSTLYTHRDYVRALAYSKQRDLFASSGFDKQIYLWDVTTLVALTPSNNVLKTKPLNGQKNSVYSIAMDAGGTVVVTGSTERALRVWDIRDPRKNGRMMKLIGHTDNVKTVMLSADGTKCLSGSSDGSVKLWSLGQQRCITTFKNHEAGVWALCVDENFTSFYSGGNDCKVFYTDMRQSQGALFCTEKHPVLKMIIQDEPKSLWVATTSSDVHRWPINDKDATGSRITENGTSASSRPLETTSDCTIKGCSGIFKYHVMNDRRHILTKDTDDSVALYDVLKARKVEELGEIDYEKEIEKRKQLVYVPNWFTVDVKTGMLNISLEESDCFSAWISAKDLLPGNSDNFSDCKVNLGCVTLKALMNYFPEKYHLQDNITLNDSGKKFFNITKDIQEHFCAPKHTPLIISEQGETFRVTIRMSCGDAAYEQEESQNVKALPRWISNAVFADKIPELVKMTFNLIPYISTAKSAKRHQFTASDNVSIQKIIEHVISNEKSSQAENQGNDNNKNHSKSAEPSGIPTNANRLRILCQDQVIDPVLDLRTVKHFFWKGGGQLVLHYETLEHSDNESGNGLPEL
ncbi:uncharacterized protein TRIADDRAFT_22317 [Trichoplax adhaerens]|uniref:Uncharacterized protein n=1 Tax=Trichoplax adhaerens TaxID=10228 RepID=B3RSV8_TRIAD|nr:hypothetical protein TRIADDRAFT_22317 [Trichoplax adhaerens]EDV27114.1 hypothetical protein TRIADDRAFT_22317 [Trichoplax adhaerens]|eukprot:XP_002111110.1 hypothetical protein TRIADDRAFT_22317 [Trichoplax adhaerens]